MELIFGVHIFRVARCVNFYDVLIGFLLLECPKVTAINLFLRECFIRRYNCLQQGQVSTELTPIVIAHLKTSGITAQIFPFIRSEEQYRVKR